MPTRSSVVALVLCAFAFQVAHSQDDVVALSTAAEAQLEVAAVAEIAPPDMPEAWAGTLLAVAPIGATTLWHKQSGHGTALLERSVSELADAVLAARFDQCAMNAMETLGAPEGLTTFVASLRNVSATLLRTIPWEDLVAGELLYASSASVSMLADFETPSVLLAARPGNARVGRVERSLSGLMGAIVAGVGTTNVLYDIRTETDALGVDTRLYSVSVPALDNATVLRFAVREDTLLLGLGSEWFGQAVDLLQGDGGHAIAAQRRFQRSFEGLAMDAPCRHWVDVAGLVEGADDAAAVLASYVGPAGMFESIVRDASGLISHLDTMASATRCDDMHVVTETITRFAAGGVEGSAMGASSPLTPASAALLDFIPGDAVSFEVKGHADLAPLWRYTCDSVAHTSRAASEAVWGFEILQAAVDFDIERDLLSWLGSQHVSITMPSRQKNATQGQTDSVMLCLLRDASGAKKSMARLEAIMAAAAPRVLGGTQEWLREVQAPFVPEIEVSEGAGHYKTLRTVEITGLPMALPPVVYGVMGRMLVFSTSIEAIESCMAVAAAEEDGLDQRVLASHLVGRDDLVGARLVPYGQSIAAAAGGLMQVKGVAGYMLSQMPDGEPYAELLTDVLDRVTGVIEALDFVGDAVTTIEMRDGGRVRYERSVLELHPRRRQPAERDDVAALPH